MISLVDVLEFRVGERAGRLVAGSGAQTLRCLVVCLLSLLTTMLSAGQAGEGSAYQQVLLQIQERIEAGHFDEARSLITGAASHYPHNGGIENLLGVVEIEQGHTAEAEKAFSSAIADSPRLTGAYLNLSRIKMAEAATDRSARAEALRLSLKVLQLDPANDEAHYQAATIQFWNKEYRVSLENLGKLSGDARVKVGAEALACADTGALGDRESLEKSVAALARNPDLTEEDADTCVPSLRTARRADLIAVLLTASASHRPLSAGGLRMLGLAHEAAGRFPEARTALESAFTSQPTSVAILEDLARVAGEANDNQGALGYLAHARDLQPGNAGLAYEFGAVCVRMGLLAEARKAIAEALRLEPDSPAYNLAMGTVVSFSDDPTQAMPYLSKYHSLRPDDPQGLLALGTAAYRSKDYDGAAKWLEQAAGHKETAPDAHFYLGRIARQEGRLDQATTELKESLTLRAGQPDVLAELGQISAQKRDFAHASAYFDEALSKDPANYSANFGLLQLYARTGDPRREQQSRRFDEIKSMKEEQDKQMMRVIEIRPGAPAEEQKQFP